MSSNEMNGIENPFPFKETLNRIGSPRSPLSPQRRQSSDPNSSEDGVVVGTSNERLHENSCDVQSPQQSPSTQSFGSNSQESRIDSEESCRLGEGQMSKVEMVKEEVENEMGKKDSSSGASSTMSASSNDKKLDKEDATQKSATPKSTVSEKPKKAPQSQLARETLTKSRTMEKSTPTKPPAEKKIDNSPLRKQNSVVTRVVKSKNSPVGRLGSQSRNEKPTESALDKELGPLLLKQARDLISVGESPQKALEVALQALKLFEKAENGKTSLDLVMCLHVIATIYCSMGHYNAAIPVIERSIQIPNIGEGEKHAIAKFAGHMQLGDTYAMLGQLENSIMCYTAGLEIQRHILGHTDPRVGETCRYVAEANFQALQFYEAERLCQMALDIHRENGSPSSLEEAADRRLMGLICETNGNHEAALEHLVLASMAMVENGQEVEVASVDCSIGDTFLSLARYDEAILAYQKAIKVFKTHKGENHPAVGSVYVRLAELYYRTWKIRESKSYCESALAIYENPMPGVPPEEVASGFVNVAAIYESMNEPEQVLKLLHKALEIHNDAPGQQSTIAGIEAQMGVIYYVLGNHTESYNAFKNAVSKLRATGEKKSAFFGIVLNQMGLCCVQLGALSEAAKIFEEAKIVLKQEYGPYHPETLGVYSNLAGAYDAMGRVDDAIDILEYIVAVREEKLGTANPDVVEEKRRLDEMLKETGRVRNRKTKSLENLLDVCSKIEL